MMTRGWACWIRIALLLLIPFSGNAATPIISAGVRDSLFLNSDGSVWGTGSINNGSGATSPVPLLQLPNVVAIASSQSGTSFALLADGTLWGSGDGWLLDGTSEFRSQPLRVPGISGIQAIAVHRHVLALKEDGTVWAWGPNEDGQLGDGTRTDRYVPSQVIGLTNVTRIAANYSDSLALKSDGTVWVWGQTCCGAAGNGIMPAGPTDPENNHLVPAQVRNLGQVVEIAAGHGHHLARRADGTVWSWGYGGLGQNGTGSTSSEALPVQVRGLDQIVAIEVGAVHSSFALKADGTVWAWGGNGLGVLGVSGITYSTTPIQVPGLADIDALSVGWDHVLAMRRDGSMLAWGSNDHGQLGNGWFQDQAPPGAVLGPGGSGQLNLLRPAPTNFNQLPTGRISLSVASGRAPLAVETTAINASDPDGTVKAFYWKSSDGQQASGQSATFTFAQAGTYNIDLLIEDDAGARGSARAQVVVAPLTVSGAASPKVGMHPQGSLALANDGRILAWGDSGTIGLYDANVQGTLPRANSIPIANGITGAVDIAVGWGSNHVLLADGTVLGWGGNDSGEVGVGSGAHAVFQPQQLSGLPPARALAAGGAHRLALTRDGRMFAWGNNIYGQLGLGDTGNRLQPVEISGLTNVTAIAAGYFFSVALKADGSVWAWGDLQLGDATSASRNSPVQILGLANITKVFALPSAIVAQDANGNAWLAGNALVPGFGAPGPSGPRRLPLFDDMAKIVGGDQFIVALKNDGTVWTGGLESSSALGVADGGDIAGLQQLPGISDAIDIAAGSYGAMILRRDGTVLAWGLNHFGQIGDGTLALQKTPALVVNETGDGFLDLIPEVANDIPRDRIPPFLVATYATGSRNATTLYANLRGVTASGALASASDMGRFAAGYNVYVAANVPLSPATPYFQLDANNSWSAISWPMAEFLRDAALDSRDALVTATILQNVDLSLPELVGASILIGYGTDPDEMARNGRYRTIFTVPTR